jgi:hypothetical protein
MDMVTLANRLLAGPQTEKIIDVEFDSRMLDFNATEVNARWLTEKGKNIFRKYFGQGVIDVNMRKTGAVDFHSHLIQNGFAVRIKPKA